MNKTTFIRNVEKIKDGLTKQNEVWVLYKVTDADGDTYTSFNATPYFKALEDGAQITLNFTEEPTTKNGKTYQNRNLIEGYAPKSTGNAKAPTLTLEQLHARLEKVEKFLKANGFIE